MVIHRRTGWTAHIALRSWLAVLCCVALAAAGCSRSDGLAAGDAASFVEGFGGEVSTDGVTWASGDGAVPDGAQVRAVTDEVRLTLRDGTVRLAPGSTVTVTPQQVLVERGDVLLNSEGGLKGALADTVVEPVGIVRLTGGLDARVGVYRGDATVRRPAQERQLAALRELDLSTFRLAARGTPLRYGDSDAWDQELLGDAIAFDAEVARLARGIAVEFGTRPQRPAFYREFTGARVVPVLADAASQRRGNAFGPPSDVLLTMFVAQAVDRSDVVATIRKVAALRAAGARWGLIAVEFGVAADSLVAAVDDLGSERLALADRTPPVVSEDGFVELAAGGGGGDRGASRGTTSSGDDATSTGGTPSGGGTNTGGGNDGGGGGDNPGEEPGGGGDDPDPPSEEPQPVEEVVTDVVETVESEPPDDDDPDTTTGLPNVVTLPIKVPELPRVVLPLP